jgi:hypothetical protein
MGEYLRTSARLLLASIRLLNGSIALCLPGLITRQLRPVPEEQPATQYALRMFGIRTILLAIELLRPAGPVRDYAIRTAPIIHAADTIAATLATRSRSIPARAGRVIITISAINTLLSLVMQPHRRR